MFIKIMTSNIVLSTAVENPANSSNLVESGLVFEMVKSGPVPARIPDPVANWTHSRPVSFLKVSTLKALQCILGPMAWSYVLFMVI